MTRRFIGKGDLETTAAVVELIASEIMEDRERFQKEGNDLLFRHCETQLESFGRVRMEIQGRIEEKERSTK